MNDLHADDFKIGQWVCIIHDEKVESSMWGPPNYNGLPAQIIAISLPFIAVTDGEKTYTVDIRGKQFRKADRRYVKVTRLMQSDEEAIEPMRRRRRRRTKHKPDPRQCPRCGSYCVQRAVMRPGKETVWVYLCENCGTQGTPVLED